MYLDCTISEILPVLEINSTGTAYVSSRCDAGCLRKNGHRVPKGFVVKKAKTCVGREGAGLGRGSLSQVSGFAVLFICFTDSNERFEFGLGCGILVFCHKGFLVTAIPKSPRPINHVKTLNTETLTVPFTSTNA